MKYTAEEKKRLKTNKLNRFPRYNRFIPDEKIKDGFYIVESKMNNND